MKKLQHKHAGMVTAAGASSRMGRPKALLATSAGLPLALHQAAVLHEAGADPVCVVLGADAERIAACLDAAGRDVTVPPRIVFNPAWPTGRLSSIQAGLRTCTDCDGVLILPVDTAGVRPDALASLLAFCDTLEADAVRPVHDGQPGRVLWIGKKLAREILSMDPDEDFRLDHWIRGKSARFEVDDPAILHNINTPDAWAGLRAQI